MFPCEHCGAEMKIGKGPESNMGVSFYCDNCCPVCHSTDPKKSADSCVVCRDHLLAKTCPHCGAEMQYNDLPEEMDGPYYQCIKCCPTCHSTDFEESFDKCPTCREAMANLVAALERKAGWDPNP
jgi:hypothetical protein